MKELTMTDDIKSVFLSVYDIEKIEDIEEFKKEIDTFKKEKGVIEKARLDFPIRSKIRKYRAWLLKYIESIG